jgi:hypothetical protein
VPVKRLTTLLAVTLLLSADAGSAGPVFAIGPTPIHITLPSPTELRFSTASNRRFAHEDVESLIGILELPRRARLVAKVPRSAPVRFRNELPGTRSMPGFAVTHRIWVVYEPLARVLRFVQAHAHPRPRPEARFRGSNNGLRLHAVGSYEFPPVPGRSWERWLTVDMVALAGGGTAVIAQAGNAWIHTPRTVLLPRAVKRIDIVSRLGDGAPNVLVHVRKRSDVRWIAVLVNGLGLSNAEHVACLQVLRGGPAVTLRFRAASGQVLARATVLDTLGAGRSGPCNPLQLTVRGRGAVPLIGADLLLRIQRLLNVDLAPPLPRDVSDCLLRQRGWKTQSVNHTDLVGRVQHLRPELTAAKNGRRWRITFHYTGKVTLDKAGPRELKRCIRPAGRR